MLLAVHYRVMEHLGSLESTQEARVALGYASGNSYASFVLSKLPACAITRWCTLKHEPIVKFANNNTYTCSCVENFVSEDFFNSKKSCQKGEKAEIKKSFCRIYALVLLSHTVWHSSTTSSATQLFSGESSFYNVPVKSKLQHPPRANPRAFEFLENPCSNSPLLGLKSCSNAPTRTCFRGRSGGLFH